LKTFRSCRTLWHWEGETVPQEKRRRKNAPAPIHNAIDNDAKAGLTLAQLEAHLWESANILRGPVDAADFKTYIFPLLFFKRISDVWDEETADAAALFGDADPVDFPEVHRFKVPAGCHWRDVRETPVNVGTALSHAMREIERANPDTLYRVFGAADWGNREMLTDEILKDLLEGLSEVSLGNRAVSTDVLGDAYEYLIGRFADVTKRKKAGEFYTPRSVVRMMVELLDPKAGESIYDPACGTGGMLLGAIEHVQRAGGDARTFFGKIYGQEKNLTTASIARMNLVLHGIEDFQIVREDTLRSPAFTDSTTGGLATFDCVIANPPFSLKEWGRDLWEADPWGRAAFGLPPESYGDYAWVQQMLASMAVRTGRMAVVLPQGALFRKDAEGRIRRALLEQDLIEAVIGLAPNIFYGTGLAPAVVVLRRTKPAARKRKVLIADASSLFRKGRAQNFLDPEHAAEIVGWVRAFEDVPDCVKVLGLDDIEVEDWTLNISRYVMPPVGEDIPSLPEAIAAFKQAVAEARAAEDRLRDVLTEGGWLS
jgi:type I restriction enzyme M protein